MVEFETIYSSSSDASSSSSTTTSNSTTSLSSTSVLQSAIHSPRHHQHSRSLSDESAASSTYNTHVINSSNSKNDKLRNTLTSPDFDMMKETTADSSLTRSSSSSSLNGKKRKASLHKEEASLSISPGQKHQDIPNAGSDGSSISPARVVGNDSIGEAEAEASSSSSSRLGHKKSLSQQTKRIKTARACDSCRRKKIRCDVIDDGGPITGNANNGNGGLTCAHCKQYGFDCTFFLPITETRFKKKREREAGEMAAAVSSAPKHIFHQGNNTSSAMQSSHMLPMTTSPRNIPMMHPPSNYSPLGHASTLDAHPDGRISATQEWPRPRSKIGTSTTKSWNREGDIVKEETTVNLSPKSMTKGTSESMRSSSAAKHSTDFLPPPSDTRVLGPTSIAYIVHSTAFVPGAAIEQHDLKHHQTFEVGSSGDGIIKFHRPPKGHAAMLDWEDAGEVYDMAKIPELIRGRLAGDVAEKLVNSYFEKVGYLFPVMTKSEFLHLSPPSPLLLYSICGVAALSRDVPKEVLTAVKTTLNGLFKDLDLMSNSNDKTVKALLVMSLHSDLHGNTALQGGTRCWNRVGCAIRMAQDLGLHRDASGRDDVDDDAFFLEQKRRIWGCCVTADRTMSVSLGHPLAIDLTDCDVRLPSPYEVLRFPTDMPSMPNTDRPFAFNTEMLKLSILFGRVMKTIYSPTGLMKTTDEDILGLLSDIDRWKDNLPVALHFTGPITSSPSAGILHVSFACLMHLLFRVFMRISYNCPTHLSFSLTIERMTKLIKYSREAIEWVDLNDYYLDTLQFVSYGLVFCTTVQYHAWIRRGDPLALATLKRARECVTRFQRQGEHGPSEEFSLRAKTAEVITMLHESALGTYAQGPATGSLNPTAGVKNRRTADSVRGIVFKQDVSRPGGGVYVATNPHLVLNDLPKGTIILQETESGRVPALVRTDKEINGGWQPILGAGEIDVSTILAKQGIDSDIGKGLNDSPTPASELTYIGGNVWADSEGRPVNRRGSRLLTMIPVQATNTDNDSTETQSYMPNAMPRLSFSETTGIHSSRNAGEEGVSTTTTTTNNNADQSLNDTAWLNAMTHTMNSSGAFPNMITYNDSNYTLDGQQFIMPFSGQMSATTAMSSNNSNANHIHDINSGNNHIHHTQMADPLSLDEMPGGPLDFAAWDSWFRAAGSHTG